MKRNLSHPITLIFFVTLALLGRAGFATCESRLANVDCRHFGGYKPCARNDTCVDCTRAEPIGQRILIVHLGAYGAVLRSTALIPAIKRQYPDSVITWVTEKGPAPILEGVPGLERVLTLEPADRMSLRAFEFDLALVIDKSTIAAGIINSTRVREIRGFVTDARNGAIVPANPEAVRLWELGLSNHEKFVVNTEPETQLTHEALALGEYRRDEYQISLTPAEEAEARIRRSVVANGRPYVIGINTGCGSAMPNKKLSLDNHRTLIESLRQDRRFNRASLILMGGIEEKSRLETLAAEFDLPWSTTTSLRSAMTDVQSTDVMFGGDSFLMHAAIGLKKRVVAWFGPSCAHEIDFFGRGEAVLSRAPCGPCWRKECGMPTMCYDQVSITEIRDALARQLDAIKGRRAELVRRNDD